MNPGLRTRPLLWVPGVALAVVVLAIVLAGHDTQRLAIAVQAGLGLVVVWGVAAAVTRQYPKRALGPLLLVLAAVYVLLVLQASRNPLLFTLGRVTRPTAEVLLIWIMLAFPSGHLSGRFERGLVVTVALAWLLLYLPSVMLSAQIPLAGPEFPVVGPDELCPADCPSNALFVADWPQPALALSLAFRAVSIAVLMATALVLFNRLRRATTLLRRAIAPVLLASMARAMAITAFLFGSVSPLITTLTFFAIPLAIALGLMRGRLYTVRVQQRLVRALQERPDPAALRGLLRDALGDPSLSVAFHIEHGDKWVDADGRPAALPEEPLLPGRALTLVHGEDGQPAAALHHDAALLEEPILVESVAGSMRLALQGHRLEVELEASGARAAAAVERERRRIERDLHDGAQQRLIALRIKLSVAARVFDQNPRRVAALIGEMGGDVEAAIVELRAYAHGVTPALLNERGLAFALTEAALRAPIPVRTSIGDIGRCGPGIEGAVYFCCLEALQNAAKHGGAAVSVHLRLRREADTLHFSVDDDGSAAADAARAVGGHGQRNMHERIAAVGGQLSAQARPNGGYSVAGSVPIARGE